MKNLAHTNSDIRNAAVASYSVYDDRLSDYCILGINVTFTPMADNLYIAFEGTESLSDIMTDLNALSYKTIGSVSGHRGIIKLAFAIFNKILPAIESALDTVHAHRVIFTGHSLGGGIATFINEWFSKLKQYPSSAVLFGAPPVYIKSYEQIGITDSIQIDDDPVPRCMSLVPLLRFYLRALYEHKGNIHVIKDPGILSIRDHSMSKYLTKVENLT